MGIWVWIRENANRVSEMPELIRPKELDLEDEICDGSEERRDSTIYPPFLKTAQST